MFEEVSISIGAPVVEASFVTMIPPSTSLRSKAAFESIVPADVAEPPKNIFFHLFDVVPKSV